MGLPDLPDNVSPDTNLNDEPQAAINPEVPVEEIPQEVVGYQGYSLLDDSDNEEAADDDSSDESDVDMQEIPVEHGADEEPAVPASNVPSITTCDQEIQREIWAVPRPPNANIDLDTSKTETIMHIMSGFALSSSIIPPWAKEIPEQEWKEDLLQRIRQRKPTDAQVDAASASNQ